MRYEEKCYIENSTEKEKMWKDSKLFNNKLHGSHTLIIQ